MKSVFTSPLDGSCHAARVPARQSVWAEDVHLHTVLVHLHTVHVHLHTAPGILFANTFLSQRRWQRDAGRDLPAAAEDVKHFPGKLSVHWFDCKIWKYVFIIVSWYVLGWQGENIHYTSHIFIFN